MSVSSASDRRARQPASSSRSSASRDSISWPRPASVPEVVSGVRYPARACGYGCRPRRCSRATTTPGAADQRSSRSITRNSRAVTRGRPGYPSSQRSSASSPPRCPVTAIRSAITACGSCRWKGSNRATSSASVARPASSSRSCTNALTSSASNRKAEQGSSDMGCDPPAEQPHQPEHPQQGDADQTGPAQEGEQPDLIRGGLGQVTQLEQAVLPWSAGQNVGQHHRDGLHRVPESVQDRYPDEPGDEPAGDQEPVAAAAGEQQRAGDRGPHTVSERGQQTPQQLGADQVDEGQAVHGEGRHEGVPGRFEGGEAQPDGGSEHGAVPSRPDPQVAGAEGESDQLGRLLDEADAEEHPPRRPQQVALRERRGEHPEHTPDDEHPEQQLRGDLVGTASLERPRDERDRDQEATKQHQRGDEQHVRGGVGDHDREHPEQEAPPEDPCPGTSPVPTASDRRHLGLLNTGSAVTVHPTSPSRRSTSGAAELPSSIAVPASSASRCVSSSTLSPATPRNASSDRSRASTAGRATTSRCRSSRRLGALNESSSPRSRTTRTPASSSTPAPSSVDRESIWLDVVMGSALRDRSASCFDSVVSIGATPLDLGGHPTTTAAIGPWALTTARAGGAARLAPDGPRRRGASAGTVAGMASLATRSTP